MDLITLYVGVGLTGVVGCTILALIGLAAFRGWLDLKRAELERRAPSSPSVGARIDVADLKERVRRLEAIAAGVDL